MPELERLILHRLWELNGLVQKALDSHDWTGMYPALHNFCATDLSAFYFDIRKDSLYCDRPDAPKRRACRTLLDILHRALTAWLAPALPFTAEDAWTARFGEESSVHLTRFPDVPQGWQDQTLAEKWRLVRAVRSDISSTIEDMRREKKIGSSLQAAAQIASLHELDLAVALDDWADICITSSARFAGQTGASVAQGQKCERCWRVLEEVGTDRRHPTLCLRCVGAVA